MKQDIRDTVKKFILENMGFYIGTAPTATDIDHLIDIGVSIVHTRDKSGPAGGSFVQAIVNSDLIAVCKADSTSLRGIKILYLINEWCR